MKTQNLKILFSSNDETVQNCIKESINEQGHIGKQVNSFLDVILYSDYKNDLFICDISYNEGYADVYQNLRIDKRYFVPNTIFITKNKLPGVCCMSKEMVLNNKIIFDKFVSIDAILKFSQNDSIAFQNALKAYGLSYRYQGTMFLEEILKITYFRPFPYLKKIELCYEYLSQKYNISCNAIKKKIKRAIVYANSMNGQAIKNLCQKFDITCPTVKFLVSHILSELSYIEY